MAGPKLKPGMGGPKLSKRVLGTVKDAGSILKTHYEIQAKARSPGGKEGAREVSQGRLDALGESVGREVKDTARRSLRNYSRVRAKGAPLKTKVANMAVKIRDGASRVKTASAAVKAAKANGHKVQAAKLARQAAAKAAKATAALAKKVAEAIIRAVVEFGKLLLSIVSAAIPLLIVIVLVGGIAMVIASPFGIFFSSEDNSPDTTPIPQVVLELSGEFSSDIQTIIATTGHDEMRLSFTNHGYSRGDNWMDILAIFAVKTAGADEGTDVVTIDPERITLLRQVFDDMVLVEHEVRNNPIYDPDTDTEQDYHVLYITVTCKGAWDMADQYGFSARQQEMLEEMLNGSYDDYFRELIGAAGLFGMVGDGGAIVGTGSFIWPSASSTYVTSAFGPRTHPLTGEYNNHLGIDISAGANTDVLAADGGTVITAGWHWSYGNYIEIDHGNGYTTLYAHNNSLLVSVGNTVEQGQRIALVGSTGSSDGNHIHFEVKLNGSRVDPLHFFSNYTTAW